MKDKQNWDWQTPEKQVPVKEWQDEFNWVQQPCVSPDGEKIAAIVNTDEAEFAVCVNGQTWPETVEKAWSLQFIPDGRLAVLMANDDEWTVGVDGEPWETGFDYIWDLKTTPDGAFIGAAIQTDGEYGMAVNDQMWEQLYQNITGTVLSPQGASAAVVQVVPMGQADITTFASGIFSAALNGEVASETYMDIKDICFDSQGKKIAYAIRKNRLDYSIANHHFPWSSDFQFTWGPCFADHGKSVIAPVRRNGKWFLYKDNADFWNRPFEQVWNIAVHEPSNKIAAIVSEKFGKWSVCENNTMLDFSCDTMISELFYSDNGQLLIALFKDKGTWDIAVNGKKWNLTADKLWAPQVSSDTTVLAARMEKNGRFHLVVNGTVYPEQFEMMFEPAISPDNKKILLKAIKNGIYSRQILSLDKIV